MITSEQARLISNYLLVYAGLYEQALTIVQSSIDLGLPVSSNPSALVGVLTSLMVNYGGLDARLISEYSEGIDNTQVMATA